MPPKNRVASSDIKGSGKGMVWLQLRPAKQIRWFDAENRGEAVYNSESWVSLAAFDTADITDIQADSIGELLLGHVPFESDCFDRMAELAGHVPGRPHAVETKLVMEIALMTIVTIKKLDFTIGYRQSMSANPTRTNFKTGTRRPPFEKYFWSGIETGEKAGWADPERAERIQTWTWFQSNLHKESMT